jgi:nucleoside-diphosphate-sugar epimerase
MKIVIFGGSGFVGSHLTKQLAESGYEVIICDLCNTNAVSNKLVTYLIVDIRDKNQFSSIPISKNDIVINLAANQYHLKVPKKGRRDYFFHTNSNGVSNILEFMENRDVRNFIQVTTDMTYGKPQYLPVDTKHPQLPFGFYGQSKKAAENICFEYRSKGFNISIFRPRMIMGPGRLGILEKLFRLIDLNLPVPMIGNGNNHYQMVSVFDCVSAIICSIEKGIPNKEFNLGSKAPPTIKKLLGGIIKETGSRSMLIPTWGKLIKPTLAAMGALGFEIMYKEQYLIADEEYILDISDTELLLNWAPKHRDEDMIKEAYRAYKSKLRNP